MISKNYNNICVKKGASGNCMVQSMSCCNKHPTMKKIGKADYVDIETGEIKHTSRHSSTRAENYISFNRSKNELEELVFMNVSKSDTVYTYTLTYKNKQTKVDKVSRNHNYFMERLRDFYLEDIEYIYIVEPYNDLSGYHIHGLVIAKYPIIIEYSQFNQLWGRGYTECKKRENNTNFASYLTAHQTNSGNEKAKHLNEKSIAIGCLPAYSHIIRHSRGIKKAKKTNLTKEEFEQTDLANITPDYERSYYKEFINNSNGAIFKVGYSHSYYLSQ